MEKNVAPKLRVLVVGLGHMGVTHAKAYDRIDGYELAGLCCRSIARRDDIVKTWPHVAGFADYGEALAKVKPDARCFSDSDQPGIELGASRRNDLRPAGGISRLARCRPDRVGRPSLSRKAR